MTASVAAIRSPENSAGREAGNSTFQNTCMRVAVKERTRLNMSRSTLRTAPSTLTITGKKTISTATTIFG